MEIKRKVMCTSTGCIEYAPERYRNKDIDIIRIHVNFNGKEYLEGYDLDPVKFYEELATIEDPKNNLPTTAMPEVETIRAHFEKAYNDGYGEVIVIALSSKLGGTYNLIRLVAEDFKDKMTINVIDSKITSFGEGLLALKAYELIEKGVPTETIIKEIHWMMERQEFIGVVGKLDHLIYNGRLKGGKAFMGKMLSICPVLHFSREGEICSIQSVRTQKKALGELCKLVGELIGNRAPEDYILWHIYTGPTVLSDLVETEKKYGVQTNHEDIVISPVSGCHCGPFMAGYGLCFIRRDDEPLE